MRVFVLRVGVLLIGEVVHGLLELSLLCSLFNELLQLSLVKIIHGGQVSENKRVYGVSRAPRMSESRYAESEKLWPHKDK